MVRHMELIVIVVTVTVTVLLLTNVLMNRYADDEDNPVYMLDELLQRLQEFGAAPETISNWNRACKQIRPEHV
jgi:hypothetical protein